MIAKIYTIIGISIVGWVFLFSFNSVAAEKYSTYIDILEAVQITPEVDGAEKICGVWEMHVHNMLNHKEYQYMLHVPSFLDTAAGPITSTGAVPSKLIVNGQTVYIRWDFPGGYSEDSLLLRRERRAMDGTFTNFAGARGSVSGKLIRPCAQNNE
tara:strand:- start:2737 stop:3201 length:465 start_codon:yes stop_codon:yes gene_type:complete